MLFVKKHLITSIYILVELVLFIFIVFLKAYTPDDVHRILMITTIAFNAFSAIILCKNGIFIIALLSTIGADVCLAYLNPSQINFGITFFVITQAVYAFYLFWFDKNNKRQFIVLIFRIFFMLLLPFIAFIIFKDNPNYPANAYVVTMTCFYLTNILCNLLVAFLLGKKLMGVAFILFLLCDILVGLGVIFMTLIPLPSTHPFIQFLGILEWAWLFYIPSQVLLVLSEKNKSRCLTRFFSIFRKNK